MLKIARYYGYKHWTLEKLSRCFYVGKGVRDRPSTRKNRNHKWHAIVKRYGFQVEVCIGPVTNEEACVWEIEHIAKEKTFTTCHLHDDSTDIGCNFARGGQGNPGRIKSVEERLHHSIVMKGKPSPQKGKKVPKEVREKISKKLKGKKIPPRTPEHQARLNQSKRGKKLLRGKYVLVGNGSCPGEVP